MLFVALCRVNSHSSQPFVVQPKIYLELPNQIPLWFTLYYQILSCKFVWLLHIFTNLGGIAYLLPPSDDFAYEFTLIEIYGGAELTFDRNRTVVRSEEVVGDDTGYLHVGPYHTLDINKVK